MNRTYIFIFGISDYISGAPIYYANKIRFLESEGWTVIVLPTDHGKIYINDLKKYHNLHYEFIKVFPYEYNSKIRQRFVKCLLEQIPSDAENIIIETGTDYTSYWGELLAKELNAKHFIFLLDEDNPRINNYNCNYYKFKYQRGELACITKKTMIQIFSKFFTIDKPIALRAWCNNSVGFIHTDYCDELKRQKYNIGYVGRLEKNFVPNIINGIISFAKNVSPDQVMVSLMGGADKNVTTQILNKLNAQSNIHVHCTGYTWPIPYEAVKKCDVCIAGAGSALVSVHCGVPTIEMDIYRNTPIGFLTSNEFPSMTSDGANSHDVLFYLNQVLINKNIPKLKPYDFHNEWKAIETDFAKQMDYITKSSIGNQYYDLSQIKLTWKQQIKKILRVTFKCFLLKTKWM